MFASLAGREMNTAVRPARGAIALAVLLIVWPVGATEAKEAKSTTTPEKVLVTESGRRYHLTDCPVIRDKETKSAPKDVVELLGLRACKTCYRPKKSVATSGVVKEQEAEVSETAWRRRVMSPKRIRCTALTAKGARCRRIAPIGNKRCWQHDGSL